MDINTILQEISEINSLENKTIAEKFLKQIEEDGELAAEVLKMIGLSYKPFNREHLIEEMADSLQVKFSTFLAICDKTDITMEDVLTKIREKNEKWRSKISEYTINK